MLAKPANQRLSRNAERSGGLGPVARRTLQGAAKHLALDVRERDAGRWKEDRARRTLRRHESFGQVLRAHFVTGSEQDRALHGVGEFANISRPSIRRKEQVANRGRQPKTGPLMTARVERKEMVDEGGDIFPPVLEPGKVQDDHGQPVIQIWAKPAAFDERLQGPVGRRDDAQIEFSGPRRT
jgi:hypothetical protein